MADYHQMFFNKVAASDPYGEENQILGHSDLENFKSSNYNIPVDKDNYYTDGA